MRYAERPKHPARRSHEAIAETHGRQASPMALSDLR